MITVQAWWGQTPAAGALADIPDGDGWEPGRRAADAAIDAGAAVLLIVDGMAPTAEARALGAVLCGVDASRALPTADDPLAWMRACGSVRDHMPAIRAIAHDPELVAARDGRVAWWAGVLTTAVARRTPVTIAGVAPHLAALCARAIAPDLTDWLQVGFDDDDPLAQTARTRLDLRPWFSTGLSLDDGLRRRLLQDTIHGLGATDGDAEPSD